MKINQIYTQYKIPDNLQLHMYRVAAVGSYICDHWHGEKVLDKDAVVQSLLLHDTGNIIKFDFNLSHLMGTENVDISYWKKVQQDFKAKYQNDEHIATVEIAKEIHLNNRALHLLEQMGSSKLESVLNNTNWNQKIASYSDLRVDPHGVVTVEKRFFDISERYKGRDSDLAISEKRKLLCLELEKQIQKNLDFDLNSLSDQEIEDRIKPLSEYEITGTNS